MIVLAHIACKPGKQANPERSGQVDAKDFFNAKTPRRKGA
jgi:hypothetical protein